MKVVVIPATYNEKGNIERLIKILEEEVFSKIPNHEMHILVADDNSPDGTADAVRELKKKYKNLDVNVGEKKGLGAAYIRVMTYAIEKMDADIVCEIDADLSHDPRALPAFLKKIDEGFDIVVGTRYSDGGSMPPNWPIQRKAFSVLGNLLVRSITGRFKYHDWTGGYRAITKEAFLKERGKMALYQGYTFQVAFMYKAILDGFTIAEVPIHFADRELGRSKIAPLEYIVNLLKYVITERIMELKRFVKFLFVGGTGFLVQVATQEIALRFGLSLTLAYAFYASQTLFFGNTVTVTSEQLIALNQGMAAGIGAEFAILCNFMFNNFWTFKDTRSIKNSSPFAIRLLKFNFTSLASILLQSLAVWLGVRLLGSNFPLFSLMIPTRIAVLFPTIILLVIPLNYIIYNKIIWKTQYLKKSS